MPALMRLAAARLNEGGRLVIYGPLRNTLGLSRVRVAYTAGEDGSLLIWDARAWKVVGKLEAKPGPTVTPGGASG